MKQIISSGFFKWNYRDFAKGAIVAVLSAILPIILDTLNAGSFTIDWKHIGTIASATFVGYMLKQLMGGNEVIVKGLDSGQTLLLKKGYSELQIVDKKKTA